MQRATCNQRKSKENSPFTPLTLSPSGGCMCSPMVYSLHSMYQVLGSILRAVKETINIFSSEFCVLFPINGDRMMQFNFINMQNSLFYKFKLDYAHIPPFHVLNAISSLPLKSIKVYEYLSIITKLHLK